MKKTLKKNCRKNCRNILKNTLATTLTATLIMSLTACGSSNESSNPDRPDPIETYGSDVLKIYNWGEYIGEDVVSNFENEFGVKVIYEYFDSNEMMYTKLQAGDSYDIIIPSDYMIQRLIEEDSLSTIYHDLIPNIENLTSGVLNLPYDPENEYSIPYFWGNVGIVYNHENIDSEIIEKQGFEVLKNTDFAGKIYVYDSERDAFMMALKALGYSMNTEDENEIEEAYQWLIELNSTMKPAYVTDEVIDGMINGNKDIAIVYSGDATYILDENEDMSFYLPEEGTNLWSDSMVIPANSENPLLAHEFINFILDYDTSYENSSYVGYTSTNHQVMLDLCEEDFADNSAYLPRVGYEYDEVFEDNKVLKEKLADLWIRVKASN